MLLIRAVPSPATQFVVSRGLLLARKPPSAA